MGLLRSRSQLGGQQKKGDTALGKGFATTERGINSTTALNAQRQKSVSSQERPRTAHSQPERLKIADRQGRDRPKTADRQQGVDRRRSFSRPRTATSATSAGKSKDKDLEKTQVEMALSTQTIEIKAGKDTYNFPTPSPRLPPPRSATTQASPAHSPLVPAVDDSPRIGVAIGSPREGAPQWGRTHTVDQITMKPVARPPPIRSKTELPRVPDKATEQVAKKKGSWKNLGGIFGRKPSTKSAAPEPFYQLRLPHEQEEQPPAPTTRTLHSAGRQPPKPAWTAPPEDLRSPAPAQNEGGRARGMTRGMARMEARAQADRALFEEKEEQDARTPRRIRTPSIIQKESLSPSYSPAAVPRSSEEIFKSVDTAAKRNDSPLAVTDGSGPLRLDLDIPDHHMERYSVMFENFLSSSTQRRPSIIERRQSKLQKKRSLKRLDDKNRKDRMEAPQLPQRSATSPHLSKMPSLSIRTGKKVRSPSAVVAADADAEPPITAVHRPRPVKRSNTAPMQATSPARQNFSKPRMIMVTEPTVVLEAKQPHARGLSMYSENSLPPTPTSGRDSEEVSPLRPPPLPAATAKAKHAADNSGTWDMLNANPNTNLIPKRKTSLARQEPGNPYRRVKSPEDLESRVVQVSVARQVSVSKARKQVRQAFDAKQPLRPRVVELGKNRKSTMVLIEGGDD